MTNEAHDKPLHGRHRAVAIWCAVLVAAMVGAAYASVPLYRLFCEATGFDGTPRIATTPSATVLDRDRHDPLRRQRRARPALALRAGAEHRCKVKIGENTLAFYRATNTSDRPVRGMATFNVFPEQVAPFFNKLAVLLLHGAVAAAGRDRSRCR